MSLPSTFANLTDEQRTIVDLPQKSRLLVTAGPGTGKTHTLLARIEALVSRDELAPGQEVLVLSFSRAAVGEIRTRCRLAGGKLDYIRAATFDSFATHILAELDPDGPWSDQGYDERILCATALLRAGKADERLADIRHIFVDEIQDLVGVRADLIKAVLEKTCSGFSLFGDPAQGIYNFQLAGRARDVGSAALYEWLRDRFSQDLKELSLTLNHRACGGRAMTALWAGTNLNDPHVDHAAVYDKLVELTKLLPSLGQYKRAVQSLRVVPEKTAILCRTNGQALMISRALWHAEARHILQRRATDRYMPSWIAKVFGNVQSMSLDRSIFTSKLSHVGIDDSDSEMLWGLLKRTEGERGASLSLARLNFRCRQGFVPDDLYERSAAQLTVSSIHRAKGLEFDRVIIATGAERPSEYLAEEARTLYVALTRPKRDLLQIEMPICRGLMLHERTHRWLRRWDWKTPDFEIVFEDSDRSAPPSAVVAGGPTIKEIQDYISTEVQSGDEILMERVGLSDENPKAVFHFVHHGKTIGRTSESFAATLLGVLREAWRNSKLPKRIDGLRAVGVETVYGDPALTRNAGLGSSGTWLSVKVGGLGRLIY